MTRKIESLEDTKLRDLRRYLARAAAQLPSIEYTNYGIGCNFLTYQQNKGTSRRIREENEDWCLWLGKNTIIKNDEQLQAFSLKMLMKMTAAIGHFCLKNSIKIVKKLWKNGKHKVEKSSVKKRKSDLKKQAELYHRSQPLTQNISKKAKTTIRFFTCERLKLR